ncbi:MAG: outer membrane protein assembly factor BamA [Verrucomicrobiia bacterium]
MRRLLWGLVVLTTLLSRPQLWGQEEQPIVREIEVRFVGPETVNKSVVTANIQTAVGRPHSRDVIEQDVRNLIGAGYFSDVRVLEEPVKDGVKIVYQVQGKATIKEIIFEGAKRYKDERLKRELSQKVGDILDERKAHADAQKIIEMYQKAGYPDIKIEPEVNIDKDTGKAVLRFRITEGNHVFLQQIQITGNQAYPTQRLLKLFKTKRRWWGSWLAGTGVLKEDVFKEDLDKLKDFYRSKGYIDMEVRDTRVERVSPKWMVLHVGIFEGHQYKVGDIKIEGTTLFPVAELEKQLKMKTGQTFTPDGLSKDMKAFEDYYGARGYLDTAARTTRNPNVETGRIDLTYAIREGQLTYIDKIEIRGNTKTKDKVIRRELAVAPGDIYNTVRVDHSAERLRNLNYFSKVDTIPEPTQVPNRKDLVINVEEKQTGTVTFGAGFSSVDNLLGFVELTQGNFDLFNWPAFTGGGQHLTIRAQVGFKRQDYVLSFVEPWFLDQRLLFGFDAFHHESSYLSTEFVEDRTGVDFRFEKALNEFLRVGVQYGIQDITEKVSKSASQELQSQDGAKLRSSVLATLVYDARDNVFLTARGNRTELSAELVGGPVAGDMSVYKLNAKTRSFFPLFGGHVLELLGAVGVVDAYGQTRGSGPIVDEDPSPFLHLVKVDDVPIFDRYFLGGANTLRGFRFRDVGPRDVHGEPVGGNTYANATVEYTIPIVERIRGAVFFDIGEVEKDSYSFNLGDLKSDAGIGVRLNLPIGPIRLDYGYPIQTDKETGKTGKIQFSVGYQF